MKEQIKNLWVQALTSGEYKQTRASLRDYEEEECTYCALGVLCDLYAKEHGERWMLLDKGYGYQFYLSIGDGYDEENIVLPEAVKEWAGLNSIDPHVLTSVPGVDTPTNITISILNDDYLYSFSKIADAIHNSL